MVKKEKEKDVSIHAKQKSSAQDIKTLENTAAIRKRPGMYIGSLGSAGVMRLFIEAVGNVIDLYEEGSASYISIDINENTNEITVSDDGYGIPIEKLTDIMTVIHTSGKFEDSRFSIGTNGVGNKCINALSEYTIVIVKRDGKIYKQTFEKGIPTSKITVVGKMKDKKTGTTIKFKPDKEILDDFEINSEEYLEFVETISYLCKGLEFNFHATTKDGKSINKLICSKNGLLDYITKVESHPIINQPILIEDGMENKQVSAIITFSNNNSEENIISFVNRMRTKEHGTHVQGLRAAVSEVFKKYIKDNNMIPKKEKLEIEPDDVRETLVAILDFKIEEPLFDSQTKDKLTSKDAMTYTKKVITDQLTTWLIKNKDKARVICNKIILCAKGRMAAKRARITTKKKEGSIFSSISNLSKYTKASSNNPELKELFIVEGNSAGGSCAQARDTEFQSVYRLRGKPLNTHDLSIHRIVANKEFSDIINILGCGIDKTFNIDNLTHDKIIIAADSDIDGCHIVSILLTFFFKHMRPLLENGHIYVAQPPLYMIEEDKKNLYIKDKEEYNEFILNKIKNRFEIKGKEESYFNTFINETKKYNMILNNISSKLNINSLLLEYIAIYVSDPDKLLEKLPKKFPKAEVKKTKNGLKVKATIKNEYNEFIIDNTFIYDIKPITDILKKLRKGIFTIIDKNTKKEYKNLSVSQTLNLIVNAVTPKHRTRFKGLGEMNPDRLWSTTMDPKGRKLIKVILPENYNIEDKTSPENIFELLMGEDVAERKVFMQNFEINVEDLDG